MKSAKKILYILTLFLLSSQLYGQSKKTSTQSVSSTSIQPMIIGGGGGGGGSCVQAVYPTTWSFAQGGGPKTFSVSQSTSGCSFAVQESVSWLSVSGVNTSTGSFTLTATANNTTSGRSTTIFVGDFSYTVSQAGISLNTGYSVTGGGSYCAGGSGVNVGLSGSQSGATYYLIHNSSTVATLSGTGSALDFGKQTSTGTYTVTASMSGLNGTMSGSATVSTNPTPVIFTVSGGGEITPCVSGRSVDLSGTETSATYYLYRDGSQIISRPGTGGALSWSFSTVGTYTVTAISDNGCQSTMHNSATISTQPTLTSGSISGTKTICYNSSAGTLSGTAATGGSTSYSYQWQVSTDNSSWSNVTSGGTGTSYSPGNLTSTHYYRRRVYDGCDTKYTSSVKITVRAKLLAGSISGAKTISYNSSAGTLSNGSLATGGTGSYSYQWQSSTNNSSWSNISGATGTSYSPGTLTRSMYYRRMTSDIGGCGSAYTSSVKVTVTPTSGSISGAQTINYQATAATLSSTGLAVGGNNSYSYQWQSSTNNSSWSDISGATGTGYSPGVLTTSRYYRRRVYSDGNYAYTSSVKVTVRPTGGIISGAQTINYNATPSTLGNSVNAEGGNGSYNYQWQVSTDNNSWNNVSGATGSSYSPGALANSRYYRRRVYSDGIYAYTSSVKVTVRPAAGSIASAQTISYNATPAGLTNASSPAGGNGSYSYQWQISTDNSNWSNISGATGSSYSPGALANSRYYRRRVYSDGNYAYTSSVKVAVRPTAGGISGAQTINYQAAPSALSSTGGALGGNGSYSYQWQSSSDNSSWSNISSATGSSYSPGTLTRSTYYRRRVYSDGNYAYTSSVKVTVRPTGGIVSGAQTINYNAAPSTLGNSVSAEGGNGSYSYQWQSSANNSSWSDVSGATGSSYSPGTLTSSRYYRRRVYSDGNYAYTSSVKVTVRPTAGSIASAQTINYYDTPAGLTNASSPAGGNGSYSYQWQSSANNSSWSNISGATGSTYSPGALTSSTYYRRQVTSDGNSAYTSSVKVTVRPTAGSIASAQTINYNTTPSGLTNASSPAGGNGSYSYQWQSSANNSTWSNISGATSSTYSPTALTSSTYYRREVTSDGNSAYTSSVKVTVRPTSGSIASAQTINYYDTPAGLTNASSPAGGNGSYSYQWQSSLNNSSWSNISGATGSTYSPGALTSSTYYRRQVTSDGNSAYTSSVKVTVRPTAGSIASAQTIDYNATPAGLTNASSPAGGNGSYSYLWQSSPDNSTWSYISGATSSTYSPAALTSSTYYRRQVVSEGNSAYTSSVKIAIRPTAGSIAGAQTINYNATPSGLTSSGSPTGGNGSYSYQWQSSANNSSWSNISGATSSTYSPTALTSSTYYRRQVTSDGNSAYTSSVKVTVRPSAGSIASAQTINYNTTPTGLTNASSGVGGNGSYSYQWQNSSDNSSWSNISGATSSTYSPGVLTLSTWYRRGVTSDGNTAYTSGLKIAVRPTAGSIAGTQTIDYNTVPSALTSTGAPAGGNGSYSYQWQSSPDNSSWSDVTNATGAGYSPGALIASTWYRRGVTSDGNTAYTSGVKVTVNAYVPKVKDIIASSNQNYIISMKPREECSDTTQLMALAADKGGVAVQYMDGLGRPLQNVNVMSSPSDKDLIQVFEYDDYGRQVKDYLPYVAATDNKGALYADAYNTANWATDYGSSESGYAFAEKQFDNSPLSRVTEQGAPGQAWQLTGGHTVKNEYLSNVANEVALYRVDSLTDSLAVGTPSYYDAGTLYKTVTKDENWTDQGSATLNKLHTTEEFKDKQGQVLLKRSYVLENGSTTQVDELNTYYVYDDLGLLRYVFPPKAFADGNNNISTSEMDSLCYQYQYDGRKRMIVKKLPGAEPVYMVYDKRDRLIAIQDGDMRANSEWEFTKYDALNRPVMIGIKTSSKTRADQQAYLDSYSGVYYESRTSSGIGYTLTQSFADRYSAVEKKLLKVIYYDDYNYPDSKAFDSSTDVSGYSDASGDSHYFDNVKGQVTGTREKVLDGNETTDSGIWLLTTTYYDDHYRVIETLKDLYPQGIDNYEVSSSKYDFVGDVLLSKTVQSFQGNTDSIREVYSYDHAGRMTQIQYTLNNNAPVILSSMEYNELGQLKRKTLNGAPGAGAQELNYAYNIRGWLSQINDPGVDPGSSSTEKFNLALYYNTTPSGLTADAQYNGNISAMVWNTPYNDGALSPTGKQGYGFTYDDLNRLKTANYGEGSSFATNAGANNVAITGYDWNGNIMGLTRQLKGTGTIDDLSYAYDGNQLRAVNDAADRHIGYIEGATPHTVEYTYDENGNVTSDSNKGISGIKYNYLNLPRHMYAGTTKIDYLYTFSGTKVCKLNINGDTIAHYYAGNFVYEGSSLKYILNEEGMVTTPSTSPVYLYDLKDHLGNTRLEVNSSGTVTQQTDYYPFGMAFKIAGSSDNKYLYNGKELQDDAIGNGTLGWYDYGARMYDAALGRWHVVDPLAESYYSESNYQFSGNNPVRYIDPNGQFYGDFYDTELNHLGTDGKDDHKRYVVTNQDDAKKISENTKNNQNTSISDLDASPLKLVDDVVIKAMKNAYNASNSPSEGDPTGGFHEEGGTYGVDGSGKTKVVPAKPGAGNTEMRQGVKLKSQPFQPADPSQFTSDYVIKGSYHVHSGGTKVVTRQNGTPGMAYFVQPPSSADLTKARNLAGSGQSYTNGRTVTGNYYVIGAGGQNVEGGGRVYIYNGSVGNITNIPRDKFFNLAK